MPDVSAFLFLLNIGEFIRDCLELLGYAVFISYGSKVALSDDHRATLLGSSKVFRGLQASLLTTFGHRLL